MKLVYLLLAVLASASISQAQKKVLSKIPVAGKTPESFIPKGYKILKDGRTEGDLNKDGVVDIAMALFDSTEELVNSDAIRPLILLLKTTDGYVLAGKSAEVIMCYGCGGVHGDPFYGIEISNGVVVVNHYGGTSWRWTTKEKFRYQGEHFYRIGTTTDWYWLLAECEIGNGSRKFKDSNWITGQQEIIETDENCKVTKHVKQKIKVGPLIKLEDYVDNE